MGVHGDVAEDVVKDVGFGGVLHGLACAKPGGGGEHARGKHLEEGVAGEKTADGGGLPAGSRLKEGADFGEVGEFVFAQADLVKAVEILLAGVFPKLRHATAYEFRPDRMLFGRVSGPILFNQIGSGHV